ncbi:DUF6318 family protein [Arthrobacter roseus]|uniref:DUF6318 family protein n=1 Tax=Arthrobacter roseus TaxID=136274 RepID=UPI00196615E9|nr:DUF6318 family protein [Arthrobacter roseus]MBM7847925.1 hypothetical protein [Arthrobacter roseus]
MTHTFAKFAAVTALAAMVLTGCGNDAAPGTVAAEEGPQPASSTAPAINVERPETNELAGQPTLDGAKAFLYYYFELESYAQLTGDTTAMLESMDKAPQPAAQAKHINAVYDDGGWILGGTENIQNVFVIDPDASKIGEGVEVTVLLPSIPTAYSEFTKDGSVSDTREWSSKGTIHTAKLIFRGGEWRLTSLEETPGVELPEQ